MQSTQNYRVKFRISKTEISCKINRLQVQFKSGNKWQTYNNKIDPLPVDHTGSISNQAILLTQHANLILTITRLSLCFEAEINKTERIIDHRTSLN